MFHVALLEPKIPPNTGNIGRLVCALGGRLHLVGPLGFSTDERACRRAGLDYWAHLDWRQHEDLAAFEADLPQPTRIFAFSTRAEQSYTQPTYQAGDCFLFGDELHGLPPQVLLRYEGLRIPLRSPHVRSLNLANATAIATSELVRQLGHPGALGPKPSPLWHAEVGKSEGSTPGPTPHAEGHS
ncbi:MAG: tRNA (cytidine(34)-2'-O)-methyltransferase [Planctomycetes bacterium]|nr:tRNA (cytidine(34)-2'-O)-methyltransferase [Planctomycetota bacterium]